MKLYTEEQVRKAINDASLYSYINGNFEFKNSEDDIVDSLTPIELPTDEEIEKESYIKLPILTYSFMEGHDDLNRHLRDSWVEGIEWYKKQLKKQI